MPKTLRERYTKMLCHEDVTFCTDKMRQKLGDVAVNDMLNVIFGFIETIREESLKEGEEMGEKIGIAKCINLIPEQKAIVPLGGDNKYYAGYNAGIRLTRDNFDKYFKSL